MALSLVVPDADESARPGPAACAAFTLSLRCAKASFFISELPSCGSPLHVDWDPPGPVASVTLQDAWVTRDEQLEPVSRPGGITAPRSACRCRSSVDEVGGNFAGGGPASLRSPAE